MKKHSCVPDADLDMEKDFFSMTDDEKIEYYDRKIQEIERRKKYIEKRRQAILRSMEQEKRCARKV